MKNTDRLNELDGLRGLAAIFVVFYHYFQHYDSLYGHSFVVPDVFTIGYYGVHLFFMISGFVIYLTISKCKLLMDFVWSRLSRLFPAYWFAIISTTLVVSYFGLPGRDVDTFDMLANFTMLQGYLGIANVDGVYWTLALELAFYFWMGVIWSLGKVNQLEKILLIWVSVAACLTFYKFGLVIEPVIEKAFLLSWIEYFAAGVCFYKFKTNTATVWTVMLLLGCLCAIFMEYPTIIALGISTFFLIWWWVITGHGKFLGNKYFAYFGVISYSLYLLHQNIGYVLIRKSYEYEMPPLLAIFVTLIILIFMASAVTKYLEKPSLSFLRTYYKQKQLKQIQKLKIQGGT